MGHYDPARNPIVSRVRYGIFDVRDQDRKPLIEVKQDLEFLRDAVTRAILDVNFRMDALGDLIS